MFEKHKSSKPESSGPQAPSQKPAIGNQTPATGGKAAIIGAGIRINGDISGDDNLLIEGRVDGKIRLEAHQVEIGPQGKVKADITAKVIRIAGQVRGDLTGVEKVVILSSGKVQGNIVSPRMTLEDGALFKGSIDMNPAEPAKPAAAQPAAKPVEKAPEKKAEAPKPTGGNKPGGYSLHGS